MKTGLFLLSIVFGLSSANAQLHNSLQASVDSLIAKWDNKQSPAISIVAVKKGQTIYARSLGMANINAGKVNDSTTTFWIASVSKQFTAAAIYLLASQGKLQLQQSVRTYLPALPDLFKTITIDQLVHHTSGLRDGFVLTALSKKPPSEYTNQNVLERLKASEGLNNPAGTTFEYNNSGYVLLAAVIEKVTGKPFPEYMRENIFRPLGMNGTYVSPTFPVNEKQAEGYQQNAAGKFDEYHFPGSAYGSTGIITTITDMGHWLQFLQTPQSILALKSIAAPLLTTGKLNNGKTIAYAGGLEKFMYGKMQVYEHFGADEGFKADLIYFPATQVSVAAFTNNGSYYGLQELLFQVSDIIHAKKSHQHAAVDNAEKMQSEAYYYNSQIPQMLKVQKFDTYVKIGNSPEGYAAPYKMIGDTLRSLDAIPSQYILKKGMIEIFDPYYHNSTSFTAIQPARINNLQALQGEYFSSELQTSYKIIATDKGLQFEFVPGVVFDLFGITPTDFMFEYVGANYLQFDNDGFYFSREGCRRMVFRKK